MNERDKMGSPARWQACPFCGNTGTVLEKPAPRVPIYECPNRACGLLWIRGKRVFAADELLQARGAAFRVQSALDDRVRERLRDSCG